MGFIDFNTVFGLLLGIVLAIATTIIGVTIYIHSEVNKDSLLFCYMNISRKAGDQ